MNKSNTKFTIDSFKIRLPYSDVKLLSHKINNHRNSVIEETGEIEGNPKAITTDYGKDIGYIYTSEYLRDSLNHDRFITIKVTSKGLRADYLTAIDKTNIQTIYDEIIKDGIIDCSLDTLLNGNVTDIDYKSDGIIENYSEYLKAIDMVQIPHKKQGYGILIWDKKDNQGFQFSKRDKATNANPYVKCYNKELEMNVKSKEFKDLYNISVPHNLYRHEFTLKNKRMMNYYGIDKTTLKHFLEQPQSTLQSIFKQIMSKHTNKKLIVSRSPEEMEIFKTNPRTEALVKFAIDEGLTPNHIMLMIENTSGFTYKKGRAIKKEIDEIHSILKSKSKHFKNKIKINNEIEKHMWWLD